MLRSASGGLSAIAELLVQYPRLRGGHGTVIQFLSDTLRPFFPKFDFIPVFSVLDESSRFVYRHAQE